MDYQKINIADVSWNANYGGPGALRFQLWGDARQTDSGNWVQPSLGSHDLLPLLEARADARDRVARYGGLQDLPALNDGNLVALRTSPDMQPVRDLLARHGLLIHTQ